MAGRRQCSRCDYHMLEKRCQHVPSLRRGRAVYSRPNGKSVLPQTEVIYPEPPSQQARAQSIKLTRRMLLGSTVSPGRDPDDLTT